MAYRGRQWLCHIIDNDWLSGRFFTTDPGCRRNPHYGSYSNLDCHSNTYTIPNLYTVSDIYAISNLYIGSYANSYPDSYT